jgi:hypothetical protein
MDDFTREWICWGLITIIVLYVPYLVWWIKKSSEEHERWLDRKRALSDLMKLHRRH